MVSTEKDQKQTLLGAKDVPNTDLPELEMSTTIKNIFKFAWWPIVGSLFHPVYTIVNAGTIGRIYPEDQAATYMAALGLGSLTTGIMILSICCCFGMVVSSFAGPAFGDKKYDLCKRYLYRQYILNTISFAICIIPVFWIESIYIAIGQDPEIAAIAAKYVWVTAPGTWFHIQAMANGGYNQAVGKPISGFIVLVSGTVSHYLMIVLFCFVWDMKFDGLILATSL
jgi:Na+-driven multidrug efflux pump